MLVTVLGAVREPGVLEVGIGTQVGRLLDPQAARRRRRRRCCSADSRRLGGRGPGAGPAVLLGRASRTWAPGPGRAWSRCCPRVPAGWPRKPPGWCATSQASPPDSAVRAVWPAGDRRAGRTARGRPRRRPRAAAAVARPSRRPRRLRPSGRRRPAGAQCAANVRRRMEDHAGGRCSGVGADVLPVPVGGSR